MGAKKEKVDYFKKKAKKLGLDTINPFKYNPEYIDKQPFSKELTDLKLRTIQSSPEYAAMIASMDENIGRIIKELKAMKIEKKHNHFLHVRQRGTIHLGRITNIEPST